MMMIRPIRSDGASPVKEAAHVRFFHLLFDLADLIVHELQRISRLLHHHASQKTLHIRSMQAIRVCKQENGVRQVALQKYSH